MIQSIPHHSYRNNNLLFGLVVIVSSIQGLYVLNSLAYILSPVRYVIIFICIILSSKSVFDILQKGTCRRVSLFLMSFHLFLLLYGVALSFVYDGFVFFKDPLLFQLILISILLSSSMCNFIGNGKNYYFSQIPLSHYYLLGLFLLIITGALYFTPIPVFNFSDIDGEQRRYSQPTTFLLCVASIYFLYVLSNSRGLGRFCWGVVVLFFLSLAPFAGARGEMVLGFLVFLLAASNIFGFFRVVIFSFLIFWFLAAFSSYFDFESVIFYERMSRIFESGDLGLRDLLLIDSIELLIDNPNCLAFGCGFNFFQVYYSREFGMYPHNSAIEMIITFGAPLSLAIFFFVSVGVVFGLRHSRVSFVYFFALYILLISLKSGSLISMTTIPVFIFFTALGVQVCLKKLK